MNEIWKDVVGYEGLYEVSNFGQVRGLNRLDGQRRQWKGRVLKLKTHHGYRIVNLWKHGTQTTYAVHTLVLTAFVSSCPEGMECCHFDGDRSNNVLTNLRWDTSQGNSEDAKRLGRTGLGIKTGRPSPRRRQVLRDDGEVFESLTKAAQITDCQISHISSACRGLRKTAGGYGWQYV